MKQYAYGVTTASGSGVNSKDLLAGVQYPDKSSGNPDTSSGDEQSFTYNRLGQRLTFQDRDGDVHTYSYDLFGRVTADGVGTLGSGVDARVRRQAKIRGQKRMALPEGVSFSHKMG